MKNYSLKIKLLIVATAAILFNQASYADPISPTTIEYRISNTADISSPIGQSLKDVAAAVNKLRQDMIYALHGKNETKDLVGNVVGMINDNFNKTFIDTYNRFIMSQDTTKPYDLKNNPSDLANVINYYIGNLYSKFSEKNFTASAITDKEQDAIAQIKENAGKDIGYETQLDLKTKLDNARALALKVGQSSATTTSSSDSIRNTPYGSLDARFTLAGKDSLNSDKLLGQESYSNDDVKSVKLLINQLKESSGALKSINPDQATCSSSSCDLYLPIDDRQNQTPYTKKTIKPAELANIKTKLTNLPLYQEYSTIYSGAVIMKNALMENIYRSYVARLKPRVKASNEDKNSINGFQVDKEGNYVYDEKGKSLTEVENELTKEGLAATDLENMKKMTLADANLEMLVTLKQIKFMLGQIHKDTERALVLQSISGLQTQGMLSATNDMKYVQPLAQWITVGCYDQENQIEKNSKYSAAQKDQLIKFCKSPSMANAVQLQTSGAMPNQ